jgi:decaprenylphospho-beta-D-ribofuranose 2-oxidase
MAEPRTRSFGGWGRSTRSVSTGYQAADQAELGRLVRSAGPRGLLPRGLGRSYGDAAQNAGGALVGPFRAGQPVELDSDSGLARLSAGTSLGRALSELLPQGRSLPVLPGTAHVSVGGAVAADVHGKNHHVDGSFGSWVRSLTLVDGMGEIRDLGPDTEPEAFWATVGGLGLTGIVTEITVQTLAVPSADMLVRTRRTVDLSELLDAMTTSPAAYHVAWVDGSVEGFGRGVLEEAEPDVHGLSDSYRPRRPVAAPALPVNAIRPQVSRALNQAWWLRAPKDETRSVGYQAFFHPLDRVRHWPRLYGPAGFLQWQYVVPDAARDLVEQSLWTLAAGGCPPALVVVKRFGPADPSPLSFPMSGWTVAADLPVGAPGLELLLDRLDEQVSDAGGRVYLAKDARLVRPLVERMYPDLDTWRKARRELDPREVFVSDLSRRLGLT